MIGSKTIHPHVIMTQISTTGLSPSWYLSRLTVKDIHTNQKWYFVCDNWLAVESDDGKVCRVIPVANDQELTNFNQLFTARTVKGTLEISNSKQTAFSLNNARTMILLCSNNAWPGCNHSFSPRPSRWASVVLNLLQTSEQ